MRCRRGAAAPLMRLSQVHRYVDGHNPRALVAAFREARHIKDARPVTL